MLGAQRHKVFARVGDGRHAGVGDNGARFARQNAVYNAPTLFGLVVLIIAYERLFNVETVEQALDIGFTSVMLDGSLLPLEENIKTVKGVVETAKEYGATVEAELGVVGGNEGEGKSHKILCTNPDDAKRFCDETGVDALAVAIGNAHGNYPVLPELRFDVLEEIHKKVNTPLVLHGGTGISDEQFQRAISLGVRKINIATASFDSLASYAKTYCDNKEKANYFELSACEVEGVYQNVKRHIKVFNME